MNICHVLEVVMDVIAIFLIIFMVNSIKKKEREDEEDRRSADSYQFFQGHCRRIEEIYKNEAHQYRDWLYFGLNYGCRTPAEMKLLIDDLVKKIGELESCKRT